MMGRGILTSDAAKDLAARICAGVPQDQLRRARRERNADGVIMVRGLTRPLWMAAKFEDTPQQRAYMRQALQAHEQGLDPDLYFSAHGVCEAADLCQILLDGELKHYPGWQSYGRLQFVEDSVATGGFYDQGWGVFAGRGGTIRKALETERDGMLIVPLDVLDAVLLPRQMVPAVTKAFPHYTPLIKSYEQFADELGGQ